MSETPQAFYLRLNNHQGFITSGLADLYANESLVDVTLTAEGQMIRCHQVVLAACSPYFKDIFIEYHKSTHYPIVIIKDMPFADLKAIVEFVYRGEITIPRQQLQSILTNGAVLQIKGLHEFMRNNLSEAEDAINESITDRNQLKSFRKNSINACETKTNKKRTRKSRTSRPANGGKCVNHCHILSSEDNNTNDEITGNNKVEDISDSNNKNNNENKKMISENCPKKVGMNECLVRLNGSETIASLMNSKGEHNMENSMTANAVIRDNTVAFKPVEQSMMIDVKQNVNINANHQSDESSPTGAAGLIPLYLNINSMDMIDNRTESVEQQNNKSHSNEPTNDEINQRNTSDNISLQLINPIDDSFDGTEIKSNTSSSSLISAAEVKTSKCSTKKRTQRVSKAGIPRKANSVRSQKKFKCPVCQKIYVSPQNMREHLRNTHTNPNQKYVCVVCERKYSWKHALDRHVKSKHSTN